jgi:hypothetical protein
VGFVDDNEYNYAVPLASVKEEEEEEEQVIGGNQTPREEEQDDTKDYLGYLAYMAEDANKEGTVD